MYFVGKLKNYQKIKQVSALRKQMKAKQKKLDKQIFTATETVNDYTVSVSMLGNRQAQHVHVKDNEGNLVTIINDDILGAIANATTDVLNQIGTARDQIFNAATKSLIDENDKTKNVNKELQVAQKELNEQNFHGIAHLKSDDKQPEIMFDFKGNYACLKVNAKNLDDLSSGKLSRLITRALNNGIANIDLATDVIYDKYAH